MGGRIGVLVGLWGFGGVFMGFVRFREFLVVFMKILGIVQVFDGFYGVIGGVEKWGFLKGRAGNLMKWTVF